ncbi:MAG: hypothetical protein WA254_19470 [Candidatus Sulfotelmatobacter sp.]|jgi:hypothetical protein
MLRKILLVVMAVVTSFALTACSGYILYTLSEGRSEGHLSLMIRFIFNPAIAVLVGVLVGLLSNDHPALTSIVGLVPWVLMLLHGSGNGGALLAWIGRILVYLALAAGSAALVGRFRHGREAGKRANVSIGMKHS